MTSSLYSCCRYLFTAPNGTELLCQLLEQLIFSAGLWARASIQVLSAAAEMSGVSEAACYYVNTCIVIIISYCVLEIQNLGTEIGDHCQQV